MIRLPELLFVYYYTTTSPSLSWLFTKFTSPSWFRGVWSWSFGFVVDIFWSTCCRWVCLCSIASMDWVLLDFYELYPADHWRWWLLLDGAFVLSGQCRWWIVVLLPGLSTMPTIVLTMLWWHDADVYYYCRLWTLLPDLSTTPMNSIRCRGDVFFDVATDVVFFTVPPGDVVVVVVLICSVCAPVQLRADEHLLRRWWVSRLQPL